MSDLFYSAILKILNRARWAPSGDNVQPWRFRIVSDISADVIAEIVISVIEKNLNPYKELLNFNSNLESFIMRYAKMEIS